MSGLDIVKELYGLFREERARHQRERGVVWVTDLVSCSLKPVFSLEYEELALSEFFSPPLVLGTLVHRGLEALLSQVLAAKQYRVEVEPERSLEVSVDDAKYTLKGRADLVVTTPEGARIGVEIKTLRGDAALPLEHHVDQARIYNLLFDLEKSYLVYISPERLAQYEVGDRMGLDEVASRIREPRAPRYTWECRYCPFSVICPSKVTKA